jgi:hypothetical protein
MILTATLQAIQVIDTAFSTASCFPDCCSRDQMAPSRLYPMDPIFYNVIELRLPDASVNRLHIPSVQPARQTRPWWNLKEDGASGPQ